MKDHVEARASERNTELHEKNNNAFEAVTWLRELVRALKLCTFYLNNVMLNIVYYLNTFYIYESNMFGGVIQ